MENGDRGELPDKLQFTRKNSPDRKSGLFNRKLLLSQQFFDLKHHSLSIHPRRAEDGLVFALGHEAVGNGQDGVGMPCKSTVAAEGIGEHHAEAACADLLLNEQDGDACRQAGGDLLGHSTGGCQQLRMVSASAS